MVYAGETDFIMLLFYAHELTLKNNKLILNTNSQLKVYPQRTDKIFKGLLYLRLKCRFFYFMSFCRILSTLCRQVVFHIVPHFSRGGQKCGTKSTE